MSKVYVIGIGYRPLDARSREVLLNSEVILASNRLYEVFKGYDEFAAVKDRIKVINKVDETISFIHSSLIAHHSSRPLVLLASGDPLFFGIGRKALEEFGTDRVEILPDLSSIQLAFSRIKQTWDNAFLMSLHGGPDPKKRRRLPYELKDLPMLLERHQKIAILTDRENNPQAIAKSLVSVFSCQPSALSMFVCERLGYEDEKITEGSPEKISGMIFRDPNVVIITRNALCVMRDELKEPCRDLSFGLTEGEILHSRGLITKDEVRAVTLHKLHLPKGGVFWDIGAGSGSISIEAAGLCPGLRICAIEKEPEQVANITENLERFSIRNVAVITGQAPEALSELPAPDRVFIGGSGNRLEEIVGHLSSVIHAGIVVINSTTIETLSDAVSLLEKYGFDVEVSEVSVSRSKRIGEKLHMSALNPVFVIKGEKN